MAKKKSFKGGFDALIGIHENEQNLELPKNSISSKKNETRTTFIVECDKLELIKSISYWERKKIKDVFDEALDMYINKYKADKGEIPSLPEK